MSPEIYLSVMITACFGTFIAAFIFGRPKIEEEFSAALKNDITSEQMEEVEQKIQSFLNEKKLPCGLNISEIGLALNIREAETAESILGQAHLSEPCADGVMIVTFRAGLSQRERIFAFAHECGHILNGDIVPINRPSGKHKDLVEQKADYVAAALLMPIDTVYAYLEENHYREVSTRKRIKLMRNLSRIYNVDEIVALRRIREVYAVKK